MVRGRLYLEAALGASGFGPGVLSGCRGRVLPPAALAKPQSEPCNTLKVCSDIMSNLTILGVPDGFRKPPGIQEYWCS